MNENENPPHKSNLENQDKYSGLKWIAVNTFTIIDPNKGLTVRDLVNILIDGELDEEIGSRLDYELAVCIGRTVITPTILSLPCLSNQITLSFEDPSLYGYRNEDT